jgi:peptide/nickel transport system substrate-binding protein
VQAKAAKGATTADFNSARRWSARAPYKLVKFVTGELSRWSASTATGAASSRGRRVTERTIARDPARLASLLAGQVDAIDAVPIPDLERLRKEGKFGLFRGPAALVHYVALDSTATSRPS